MNTPDTEKTILGAALVDGGRSVASCVEAGVTADWFLNDDRAAIWSVIVDLWSDGKHVDYPRISDALRSKDMDNLVACLEDYIDHHVSSQYLSGHIEDLCNSYKHRKLDATLKDLRNRMADDRLRPADEWIAESMDRIAAVEVEKQSKDALDVVAGRVLDKYEHPATSNYLRWPIRLMNDLWSPISDEYIVLGAAPSAGKTAFALNLLYTLARGGHRVSFASLESSVEKVVARLISIIGDVNTLRLRHGSAKKAERDRARDAQAALREVPISISHHRMTLEMMGAWGKKEKSRGSEILVLDNTRHIRPSKRYQSRVDQFADISVHGKWLRDDTGLPVMMLHHTNSDNRLSWSSDFERDADVIVQMAIDEDNSILPTASNNYNEKCFVNFDCVKNRDGRTGMVQAEFVKSKQRFE